MGSVSEVFSAPVRIELCAKVKRTIGKMTARIALILKQNAAVLQTR
jgi:hypothetical protein